MLRRLLNIASIVCLVAFVTLMGMWVRSYHWSDELRGHLWHTEAIEITSRSGRLNLCEFPTNEDAPPWPCSFVSGSIDDWPEMGNDMPNFDGPTAKVGLAWGHSFGSGILLSYWFLVLTTGVLTMLFRLRWPWRFNLRSLFIATTFLAVVLGLTASLDRAWIGK
jgi:hypothetical protein